MLQNFRFLCALCSIGALLILAGFFLTKLHLLIQIFFLMAGLITLGVTMFGLIKYFIRKQPSQNENL